MTQKSTKALEGPRLGLATRVGCDRRIARSGCWPVGRPSGGALPARAIEGAGAPPRHPRSTPFEEIRKAFLEMDLDQDQAIGPGDLRVFFRCAVGPVVPPGR